MSNQIKTLSHIGMVVLITVQLLFPLVLNSKVKALPVTDLTPPILSVVEPLTGDAFSGSMYVEVQTYDNESGIIAVNARVVSATNSSFNKTNNLVRQGLTNTYSGYVNLIGLPDGIYYLLVRSWNPNWNKTALYIRELVVDNSIPTVTINTPEDNAKSKEPFKVSGTAFDNYALDYVELYYGNYDTNTWTIMASLDNVSNSTNFNWTFDWTPTEGEYDIKAVSYDIGGTASSAAYKNNLIYDLTGPVVNVISPITGSTSDATVFVSVQVTDSLTGVHYVVARLENLDDWHISSSITLVYNVGTGYYEGSFNSSSMPAGSNYRLHVSAYDNANPYGNRSDMMVYGLIVSHT